MKTIVQVASLNIGQGMPLAIIAGPCVIEDFETTYQTAAFLKNLTGKLQIPFIFKASYDKANRTSIDAYRGPGVDEGLATLARIKADLDIALISDVHDIHQIEKAAQVLDVLQVPAFLCRQTDFILEVARSGKPINIKKGQFLAPWDVANIIEKMASVGNRQILLTERGAMFGYNNLVVDFRSVPIMQATGYPVIFDATHSVQLPGGAGTHSGGQRQYAPVLARAAVAAGADAIFMEVHPDPDHALCDGPNSLPTDTLEPLLVQLKAIRSALTPGSGTP
ncbi:MAG: 2-dehydro-3-deoxyphosphooctonate aldolase [Desulfatitalea sp. BRH_c12]|nr:MAG: 2-dehydro-3-deoxyphosphooctonate aldolase [Desulfatitalea sp. BRH_c12]